jgi:3-hydroxy-9,10-secoandrosta-1,3,5(10)-triene-9,17-dione monooxygenase
MNTRNLNVVSGDTASVVLERARALVPVLAARSAETEATRRVPDETIADFHRAGLFRVMQPARFGGLELDFGVFASITRELAKGCGSSAWVYAVVEELFWVLATFPEEAQQEIWGEDPNALACASVVPTGSAVKDGDGYRLNGDWHFLSGSDHATWVFLTAPCDDGKGGRELRNFFVRRAELQVIDDWHVMGLAGTGSKSVKADGVFAPAHRSVRYDDILNGTAPGVRVHPGYRLCRAPRRYLTAFSISPVILGLANRALDITTGMLRSRIKSGAVPDQIELIQQRIAESTAELNTANMIFETHLRHHVAGAAWCL